MYYKKIQFTYHFKSKNITKNYDKNKYKLMVALLNLIWLPRGLFEK